MATNPGAVREAVLLMAFYLHLGPFSREFIGRVGRQIDALETQERSAREWRPQAAIAASTFATPSVRTRGRISSTAMLGSRKVSSQYRA